MAEVFLDSAYAIAIASPDDLFHDKAIELAEQMNENSTSFVVTRAVLLEIGNALSRLRFRAAAIALLEALEEDPRVVIIPLSDELFARAFQLYRVRRDKEWGLIDCMSFTVMWERGLNAALTTDDHYRQAGFRALLRDP